jgi:hypothetical protein
MAVDWKEQLIATIKDDSLGKARASARAEALEHAWLELEVALASAVSDVSHGIGITIEPWGTVQDGRVRWQFAGRQLAVYVDRATARCIVSIDLGHGLEMWAFSPNEGGAGLLDEAGVVTAIDEICERAVSLLFRGRS